MLLFGMKAPFSFESFLERCQDLIPDNDMDIVKSISLTMQEEDSEIKSFLPIQAQWYNFQRGLKNELVRIRAARRKIDPVRYLRKEGLEESSLMHAALAASRNTSILDAERFLDQKRWEYLDELEVGHYFDFEYLYIYAWKLCILLRWERISREDGAKLLEGVLTV